MVPRNNFVRVVKNRRGCFGEMLFFILIGKIEIKAKSWKFW